MATGGSSSANFFDLSGNYQKIALQAPARQFVKTDKKLEPPPLRPPDKPVYRDQQQYVKYYTDRQQENFANYKDGPIVPRRQPTGEFSVMDEDSVLPDNHSIVTEMGPHRKSTAELLAQVMLHEADKTMSDLPINSEKEEILDAIESNTITIISGPTGCGKTTMIPQFILKFHKREGTKAPINIIVTQPRRIAAMSIAKRVSESLGLQLGRTVGYKVGLDKQNCGPDTILLYCTTGILKKILISQKCLSDYSHVILDEVHDREEDMDFVLLLCKEFIFTNSRNVKLILMSATLNCEKLRQYFSYKSSTSRVLLPHHHKISEIRKFNILEFFLDNFFDDRNLEKEIGCNLQDLKMDSPQIHEQLIVFCCYIISRFDKIELGRDFPGAVLIFLPGEAEISRVKNYLEKHESKKWKVLPLHSRIPADEARAVFDNFGKRRKIILSTNIAESSITIPDIEYVIDFCLTKLLICDPTTKYVGLKLEWADKNNCEQRKGRCGRTRDGRVYRLVFQDLFRELPSAHLPEMLRAPLEKVILDSKLLDYGPPKRIMALSMDPPDEENISATIMQLKQIGALLTTTNGKTVENDGDLTLLGEIMASLPLDVNLSKLVVLGFLFDVLDEAIIVAAGMSGKPIFASPFEKKCEAYAHKLLWAYASFSDAIAVLNAYKTWKKHLDSGNFNRGEGYGHDWCKVRFLQHKNLLDMDRNIEEIKRALRNHKIENPVLPNLEADKDEEKKKFFLQLAIFGAFYPNYLTNEHGTPVDMKFLAKTLDGHPYDSTIYVTGFPLDQSSLGDLYVQEIKTLFSKICVTSPENIEVHFVSGRIIIRFVTIDKSNKRIDFNNDSDRRNAIIRRNLTGEICHQVYVAMKFSRSQQKSSQLYIPIYTRDVAEKLFHEQKEKEAKLNSSIDVRDAKQIGIIEPPTDKYETLMLDVVYVNNPNSFWVTLPCQRTTMTALGTAIESIVYGSMKPGFISNPKTGLILQRIYLCPFESDYYRARLDSLDPSNTKATVFFIDFGNVEVVDINQMIPITDRMIHQFPILVKAPAQSLECSLAGIVPNDLRNPHQATASRSNWDTESIEAFKSLFPEIGMEFSIFARIITLQAFASGPRMNLKVSLSKDFSTTINDQFMEMKDRSKRPLARLEADLDGYDTYAPALPEEMRNYRLKEPHKINYDLVEKHLYLKGPIHPLEIGVRCVTRVGVNFKVRIENESVNSVFLDRFPTSSHCQWLVASRIDQTQNHQTLIARNTTYMPNLPGIGPLLTMVFAPRVELRRDDFNQRYIGCLAGLGSRGPWFDAEEPRKPPASSKPPLRFPYHADNDMELPFDVVVSNEDIHIINCIRLRISLAISRVSDSRNAQGHLLSLDERRSSSHPMYSVRDKIIEHRREIRSLLERLLLSNRKTKDMEYTKYECNWDRLPTEGLVRLSDLSKESIKETDFILPRFQYFQSSNDKFASYDRKVEDLKAFEFNVMKELASGGQLLVCPICPKATFQRYVDAQFHVKSEDHINQRERVGLELHQIGSKVQQISIRN